jgi:ribosomal protein L10
MVTRLQKEEKLNELKDCIKSHQSVIVINYSQFLNEQNDRFRDEFFAKGGNKVIFAKNNLVSLAAKEILNDQDIVASEQKLKNSNLFVFSNDIFGTIRALNSFAKSLREFPKTKMTISCGILDNGFLDEQKIKMFADIPSIESIYANLISILSSPLQNLIKICNAPMVDLCKVLDYKINKC